MPTVYVIQKQMRFDPHSGELVPRFSSINDAEKYGELVYLLSPTANVRSGDSIIKDLHKGLEGFTSEDYLLIIGSPLLIAFAAGIAVGLVDGPVNFLMWVNKTSTYECITADLFPNE